MRFSIKDFFCKCDQFPVDLVTFTEKILSKKHHFLCSVSNSSIQIECIRMFCPLGHILIWLNSEILSQKVTQEKLIKFLKIFKLYQVYMHNFRVKISRYSKIIYCLQEKTTHFGLDVSLI